MIKKKKNFCIKNTKKCHIITVITIFFNKIVKLKVSFPCFGSLVLVCCP